MVVVEVDMRFGSMFIRIMVITPKHQKSKQSHVINNINYFIKIKNIIILCNFFH